VFFLNNKQHEEAMGSGASVKEFLNANSALKGRFEVYLPVMPKFGTHHSKAVRASADCGGRLQFQRASDACLLLMRQFLIAYPTHLRVCIHTANLDEHDWTVMTQGAWMQDFPTKAQGAPETSEFETQLLSYFQATGWPGGNIGGPEGPLINRETLKKYDFSGARVRLAASVPYGRPFGPEATQLWGHLRMKQLLSSERFAPEFVSAPVVWQFSSLSGICNTTNNGQYNRETCLKWVHELDASFSAGRVAGEGGQLGQLGSAQNCKFVWPTRQEVAECIEPETGGGMPSDYVNAVTKMDALLSERRCRWAAQAAGQAHPEGRQRVMPHIKTFLRHRGQHIAWLYLGSSNLSRAAWGEFTGKGNAKQFSMKSFELGVVFVPSLLTGINGNPEPLKLVTTVSAEAAAAGGLAGVTPDGRYLALPVPYPLSPVPYQAHDVPWYTSGRP
jgi:tyrosyl-DNA phosphodiesterase-1